MTGLYVPIKRDGSYVNVEFDQLTDDELVVFAATQPEDEGWSWAVVLAKWIRENVKEDDESRIARSVAAILTET
jgi:hypothetical protein